MPDLEQMIEGALRPIAKPMAQTPAWLPLRGGFQALMTVFLPLLRGDLKLNSQVARVVSSEHRVIL